MASDIEIARAAAKRPLPDVAAKLGIPPEALVPFGHDKAKLDAGFLASLSGQPEGKLILVTAINPTPPAKARRRPRSASVTG